MSILNHSVEQYLTGDNVFLRPLKSDDYDQYREVRERCHDWLAKWEPTVNGVAMDTTSSKDKFMSRVTAYDRGSQFDTAYGYGIFLHNGTFIGEVSIGTIVRGPFQSALLGYWIDEKYAGRNFVPEALKLVVGYAFTSLGFMRLEIAIIPDNYPSIRVAEKLGFEFEGISKEYIEVNTIRHDHARYSMTYDNWTKSHK